jgi:hypothetical protein
VVFLRNDGSWAKTFQFFKTVDLPSLREELLADRDIVEQLYAFAILEDALVKSTYEAMRTPESDAALRRLRKYEIGHRACILFEYARESLKTIPSPPRRLIRPPAVKRGLRLIARIFEDYLIRVP